MTPPHASHLHDDVARVLRAAGCVYADDEARLLIDEFDGSQLDRAVARRVEGIPLEHLLGWTQFGGVRIAVEPGVFVPRSRTWLLVERAAQLRPKTVLDMCCGSGAVGVALAHEIPGLDLHAVDIDPVAVRCAGRNVESVGGHVYRGDLYEPLPAQLRGSVDVIVANAPYVPTDAIGSMPSEARDHEPRTALDGGVDGLVVQRFVAEGAGNWLTPGGHLLIETSLAQAEKTAHIFADAGLTASVVHSDELDGTVVVGARSADGERAAAGPDGLAEKN